MKALYIKVLNHRAQVHHMLGFKSNRWNKLNTNETSY